MEKRIVRDFCPFFISMFLAVVTAVAYSLTAEKIQALPYFQLFGSALVPAIPALFGQITKKRLPVAISYILAAHVAFSIYMGTVLRFYDRFEAWDMIAHGVFGFVGCTIASAFMVRWRGGNMHVAGFLLVAALSTMGAGAVWEIFEYCCDTFLGMDTQCVQKAIAEGKSPVSDTMEDIIITLAGITAFVVTFIVDRFTGEHIAKAFFGKTDRIAAKPFVAPPAPDGEIEKND